MYTCGAWNLDLYCICMFFPPQTACFIAHPAYHYYIPGLLLNLQLYEWAPGTSLHLIKTHSFFFSLPKPKDVPQRKKPALQSLCALVPIKMLTCCFLSANWQYLIHQPTLEKQSLCGWQKELELQAKHQNPNISVTKMKKSLVWCLVRCYYSTSQTFKEIYKEMVRDVH